MTEIKQTAVLTDDQIRDMRAAMRKAGANPLGIAEVIRIYPGDKSRCRIAVGDEERDALRPLAQWTVETGDLVYVRELRDGSGRYEVVGMARSATTGDQTEDPRAGRANIPGTELPLGADGLWEDFSIQTAGETTIGHHIRPKAGEEVDPLVSDRIHVYGGRPDAAIESYGDFIIPGDRLMIARQLPAVIEGGPWCTTGEDAPAGTHSYLSGALIGYRPWVGGPYLIGGGFCGSSDTPTMLLGNTLLGTHERGFDIHIKLVGGAKAGEILYFKYQPFLSDKQFIVRYLGGGSIAVGWTYEILNGTPAYPSDNNWTTFSLPPTQNASKDIRNRQGEQIGIKEIGYYDFTVSYVGNNDGTATVSCNGQSHNLTNWIWGGQPMQDWVGYAGAFEGFLLGSLDIASSRGTHTFNYGITRPVAFPRGLPYEIAVHRKLWPGDPVEGGAPGETYSDDPGDLLDDGLYLCLFEDQWVKIAGIGLGDTSDQDYIQPDQIASPTTRYPDLSQLGGLDQDVLTQYANVDRIIEMLGDAGISTDDVPASATSGYVSPTERDEWDAVADARSGDFPHDLSAQIDGVGKAFATADTFVADSLRVKVNNTILRNGRDFRENATLDGFEVDYRLLTNDSPADVLRVAYQIA